MRTLICKFRMGWMQQHCGLDGRREWAVMTAIAERPRLCHSSTMLFYQNYTITHCAFFSLVRPGIYRNTILARPWVSRHQKLNAE